MGVSSLDVPQVFLLCWNSGGTISLKHVVSPDNGHEPYVLVSTNFNGTSNAYLIFLSSLMVEAVLNAKVV